MATDPDPRPVIWAFSTSRLRHVFESVAPLLADAAHVRVFDQGFEDALRTTRELVAGGERVDALVAAGSNGAYLRDHAAHPVIVVSASTLDALQALVQARKLSPRIGVVNFLRVVTGLEQARQLFGDTVIEQRAYVTPEEARAHVDDLAGRGVEVIIGPGPVCDLAERAGLAAVLLYGQDSLGAAIRQAVEIARIARGEEARRAHLQRIFDQLETGLLAVDEEERVLSANPALLRLLGRPAAEVVGRQLSEIAPALGLARALESGLSEPEAVERIGGRTVLVTRSPVRDRGVVRGAVLTALDAGTVQRQDRRLRTQHRPSRFEPRYTLGAIVGDSPQIVAVRALAARYARTDATVLISGESGTGKEMVAQGIHAASHRRDQPFVAVNCAAFPEALLEAELFGHEEGAFTGARRGGRPGLFEAAHLGTIFLDEIGDVPVTLQTRLLRVLQERQVLRLGSNEPTPVDVRVIAATHLDLRVAVAEGRFRKDLYYRLQILPLHIPPLRERPGDVAAVARDLLSRSLARDGTPPERLGELAPLLARLEAYPWPGNVRELENVLERLALLLAEGEPGRAIPAEELGALVPGPPGGPSPTAGGERPRAGDLRSARARLERAHVEQVLAACGGNLTEAARRLGVGRSTVYRKLADRP